MIGPLDVWALEQSLADPRPVKRPVMRYFGGKWKLAPWIISHFPPHSIYVEPYGGAASVLLRKVPIFREIYNDLNGDVINLFRVLQDHATWAELHRRLCYTPFAREEYDLAAELSDDPVERAARLLVVSWLSFGGAGDTRWKTGFRTNIKQVDKDPAREWLNWFDALPILVARLRRVTIEHAPAVEVIRGHDSPHTLFYVDPPYPHQSRKRNDLRYKHEMTEHAHRDLADVLHSCEGMVVLSGYQCPLYDALYGAWKSVSTDVTTNGAGAATETLWLSPHTVAALAREQVDSIQTLPLFARLEAAQEAVEV